MNSGTGVTGAGVLQESFDPGIIGNLAIGYAILDHVRIEGEFGYGHYEVNKLNPSATPLFPNLNGTDFNRVSGGGVDQYSGTLNAFYDVPIGGPVIPYVGGGLGMLHSELEQGTYRSPAAGFRLLSTSPSAGLAIAEVGVAVPVGGVSIVPAYRYLQTFGEAGSLHEVSAHVVKIGLRYSF